MSAAARSSEPTTRSSVAPSGSSTNGAPSAERRRGPGPAWTWPSPSRPGAARRPCAGRWRPAAAPAWRRRGPTTAVNGKPRPGLARSTARRRSSRPRPPAARRGASAGRRRWRPTCPARRPRAAARTIPAQRPGVGALEELAHRRVDDVRPGDPLVHPVLDDVGGGVVAEQVVDRGRDLERALVAVAAHGVDPLGVDDPGAHDPGRLLGQVRTCGRAGSARVAEPGPGAGRRQRVDGGDHAAVVLEVVVAVEDVVLAVVLVLHRHLDGGEPAAHRLGRGHAVLAAPVGVADHAR